ncbi:MAG: ribonuclease VapC [Actinomycetota bacterium]|nr:ribonuclease VapC [Actinomycetota bacterium]
MIVDSSAFVAIAKGENEQIRLIRALSNASVVKVSAPTWFETSLVLSRMMGPRLEIFLSGIERQFALQFVPFGVEHVEVALDAWSRYGKGKHHARLNFGDCISYATAQIAGEPLLFVGNDFAHTDIEAA